MVILRRGDESRKMKRVRAPDTKIKNNRKMKGSLTNVHELADSSKKLKDRGSGRQKNKHREED